MGLQQTGGYFISESTIAPLSDAALPDEAVTGQRGLARAPYATQTQRRAASSLVDEIGHEIGSVLGLVARGVEALTGARILTANFRPLHPMLISARGSGAGGRRGRSVAGKEPTHNQSSWTTELSFVGRRGSLGTLELEIEGARPREGGARLKPVGDLGTLAFDGLIDRCSDGAELAELEHRVKLADALVACSSLSEVASTTTQYWSERASTPAAIWVMNAGSARMVFTASVAIDVHELPNRIRNLPPWEKCLPAEREDVCDLFAGRRTTGAVSVTWFGTVLFIAACEEPKDRDLLHSMIPALRTAIDRCGATDRERERNKETEAGMACAIHEVRGSLLAARNAIDVAVNSSVNLSLLDRSREELERTSHLAEILLRCCKGFSDLDLRREDLRQIIDEAVDSSLLERGEREVRISGPSEIEIVAEEHSLRSAVANVVRNALGYSSNAAAVDISIVSVGELVELRISSPGPEIDAEEREKVFQPFFRGSNAGASSGGSGLGLFLARRILEAHGGSIRVRNDRGLTTFHIVMPRLAGRR